MNPCAIGPPKGLCALARSTSTWIHWWSPVASAKRLTLSWVISNQSLVPSSVPMRPGSSAIVVVVVMLRRSSGGRAGAKCSSSNVLRRTFLRRTFLRRTSCSAYRGKQSTSFRGPTLHPAPLAAPAGYRVHWGRGFLDRRLGVLRAGPPALGPGGCGRSAAAPRRRAGNRDPPSAPRLVVAPRRHVGNSRRRPPPGGVA